MPAGPGAGDASGGGAAEAVRRLEALTASRQAAASRLVVAGEVAHLLRALCYVLALRRWGRASWRPWLLSLAIELGSLQLTAAGAARSRRAAAAAADAPEVRGTSLGLLYSLQGLAWSRAEATELTPPQAPARLLPAARPPLLGRDAAGGGALGGRAGARAAGGVGGGQGGGGGAGRAAVLLVLQPAVGRQQVVRLLVAANSQKGGGGRLAAVLAAGGRRPCRLPTHSCESTPPLLGFFSAGDEGLEQS